MSNYRRLTYGSDTRARHRDDSKPVIHNTVTTRKMTEEEYQRVFGKPPQKVERVVLPVKGKLAREKAETHG